jgi:hypothetical protein
MLKPDFLRIHTGLEQIGVNTRPLYQALGISEQDFASDGPGVSMSKFYELLELAAQQMQRPSLARY